ncbi:MAG TPA: hypothetical protein VFC99_00725 [Acidimicrobiia bacterium]|nr:hypothetical protein [Acidimicrobiia bacterium]
MTKLRLIAAAALVGALAFTATAEASASTTGAAHAHARHGAGDLVAAKKKKKKHKKKQASATVRTATITAGTVLVGPDGRTLYIFDKDNGTTSACTGGCASVWPPLLATGKPVAGPGVDASKLTAVMQADGKDQVAYAGHLLYSFSGDTAAGDAKGLGIPMWHAVSPEGAPVGGA